MFDPRLEMDDVDSDNSVSMTWEIDPASGTMRHKKTGTKVSTDSGITHLSCNSCDLDSERPT